MQRETWSYTLVFTVQHYISRKSFWVYKNVLKGGSSAVRLSSFYIPEAVFQCEMFVFSRLKIKELHFKCCKCFKLFDFLLVSVFNLIWCNLNLIWFGEAAALVETLISITDGRRKNWNIKHKPVKQHKPVGTENKNRKKEIKPHTHTHTLWRHESEIIVCAYKNLFYQIWQWLFSLLTPLKHRETFYSPFYSLPCVFILTWFVLSNLSFLIYKQLISVSIFFPSFFCIT